MDTGGKPGAVKSTINVTPLVDIVLVLLIIFLVTMPIQMRQITIEVPRKIEDFEDSTMASKQLTILVKADGSLVLNDGSKDTAITRVELAKTLKPLIDAKRTERVVFVDFEDQVVYGDAVSVMDTIKGAGAEKVALKLKEDKPPGTP
jgi:biopolymer transport protein ExbD